EEPEKLERAIKEFELVLKNEPDNLHANYCLGFILAYHKDYNKAVPHFKRVTELDPSDAGAWYQLGAMRTQQEGANPEEILNCFETAHRLNPYMSGPLANLLPRIDDEKRQERLRNEDQNLRAADVMVRNTLKYTEQGSRYARAIASPQRVVAESVQAPS